MNSPHLSSSSSSSSTNILVVGAGPVGLTLAAELARRGVRPRIIDRLAAPLPYCRAIGVTPRTLELWDNMSIARDMIDRGVWFVGMRSVIDGQTRDDFIDLSDLPYGMLGLPQYETERVLTQHLETFGIRIERGISLASLKQSDGSVQTTLVDSAGKEQSATFRYVVGCDGAHSAVRKSLAILFEGDAFPFPFMLGDVHIDWDLPRGMTFRAVKPIPDSVPDMFIAVPLPESGRYRVSMVAPEQLASTSSATAHGIQSDVPAPGIEHLQAVADRLVPGKPKLSDMRWSSVYRISMRLAASYRRDNVFIAGDAAHIHPPTGGQGMNTGIQDAYNLAWKLALVLHGHASESLLDSYEAERRPVGQEVVQRTTAASQQYGREGRSNARLADTQILVSYRALQAPSVPANESQPPQILAGDRLPDCHGLRRFGFGFPLRMFDILRGTEHVLITYCIAQDPSAELSKLSNYAAQQKLGGLVRYVAIVAQNAKQIQLPLIAIYEDVRNEFQNIVGSGSTTLLVRPDGYLAWRGSSLHDAALADTLRQTFATRVS